MANTMGTYTRSMLDLLEDQLEDELDYTSLRDTINSDEFFRPFSARLLNFYNVKTGNAFSPDDNSAATSLYNLLKKNNTPISRNTLKNWFSGTTEPVDHEAMFMIAFALKLSVDETEEFFHKVFLDKAFNVRNSGELIYKYCLLNSRSYADAQMLKSLIARDVCSGEAENETRVLNLTAEQAASDNELIEFINSHPADFFSGSNTAKRIQSMLLSELTGDENTTGLAEHYYNDFLGGRIYGKNHRNLKSIDFMLDTLLYSGTSSRKLDSDIKSVREIFTRKEVINQFPNKDTLSLENVSSYVRRKNIILLYFYKFWCSDKLKNSTDITDSFIFIDELNALLSECGFSPLYYGNPYDWLFMFCSARKDYGFDPLDEFRDIISME